mmetsp:Transcript_66775/g.118172  ORF Transcript_66775/g.118172 Transcript_66775/m.118172 type:complete len:696 (-) Transcript_66775:80-2167(-)
MSGLPPNLAQLLAAQQQPPQQPLAGLTALGQPAPPAPPGPPPGPPSLLPGGFPLLQPGAPQALYQQQQGALSVAQAAQTAIQNAQAKAQADKEAQQHAQAALEAAAQAQAQQAAQLAAQQAAQQAAVQAAAQQAAADAQAAVDAQSALDAHNAATLAELQAQAQAQAQAHAQAQAQAQMHAAAQFAQDQAHAVAEAQQRAVAQAQAVAAAEQARFEQAQQAAQREQAIEMAKRKREEKVKEAQMEKEAEQKLKCHLHKKPNTKCKFCKRHQDHIKEREGRQKAEKEENKIEKTEAGVANSRGALEIVNTKTYGFSPLMQTHVVDSAHFKALLSLESFEQLIDEMKQFAENIEPYMPNSNTTPSALFACLYRLFTMGIDSRQLRKLMDYADNTYIRCAGFLFVRFGLTPDHLWNWLGEYILDDQELRPSKDSERRTTIGEFVEGLLSQDKYYSTVLPRLPMSTKRLLEAKLAPIPQSRKRAKSNLAFLEVYRDPGVKVEVNYDGEWSTATTVELVEDVPSRLKVLVKMDSDESEKQVNLGRIILADPRYKNTVGRMPRGRSRSRSRDGTDWARERGQSDVELLEQMRKQDREKAVCSSGKEYAKKPLGYKAACAMPREQGAASNRLMEEETFVPMKSARRRSPSPSKQQEAEFRKAPSAEHQARMRQLFEKYGMAKGADIAGSRADVDGPDVMRFG